MDDLSKDQEMFDGPAPMDVADELERLAKDSASPITPGENIGQQIKRAAKNLGLNTSESERRAVRAAWYGEAGGWSARKYLDFKHRYERWKARQDRKAEMSIENARRYRALLGSAATNGSDPDFLEENLRIPDPASRDQSG